MTDAYESLLFNYETTNRTDFRYGEIKSKVSTTYRPKPARKKPEPSILKNMHTLTDWNSAPFDVYIKLKDVVRTNPRHIQQAHTEPPDLEREEAQKTRPRLTMPPAVSIDDVESEETRQILVNDIYKTTTQETLRSGILLATHAKRAPILGLPSPANPITLPKLRPPYVSPEWRMDSVTWDGRQHRAKCDASKEFYLARVPKCDVCEVSASLRQHRK